MSDNTDRPVITECRGDHTLIIKLNRPARKNAINVPLAEALAAAFERYDASPELRCAVLTGEGGTFCAGLDLIEAAGGSFPKLELFRRQPRKPLIAAVEGHALAGGFELCLLADLIVASADARMGLPE
ncbi:MAG: enoyl-CoA hydratase-related protein, partial [Myxococcota bacterium]